MHIPQLSSLAIAFCLVDMALAGVKWRFDPDTETIVPVSKSQPRPRPAQPYMGRLSGSKRPSPLDGTDGDGPLLWCEVHLYTLDSNRKRHPVAAQNIYPYPGRATFTHGGRTVIVDVDDRCKAKHITGFKKGLHRLEFLRAYPFADEGVKKIKYTGGQDEVHWEQQVVEDA